VTDKSNPTGELVRPRFGSDEAPRKARTNLQQDGRPVLEILREIIAHLEEIVRSEIRLARTEISAEIVNAARKSVSVVAAIVLSLYALGFLFWGGAYVLAQVIPLWLATIVVGLVLAITAAVLWRKGRKDLSQIQPKLERTTQTLKENLAWLRKPTT
jgi:uncharacterized membrane protein YqjE